MHTCESARGKLARLQTSTESRLLSSVRLTGSVITKGLVRPQAGSEQRANQKRRNETERESSAGRGKHLNFRGARFQNGCATGDHYGHGKFGQPNGEPTRGG